MAEVAYPLRGRLEAAKRVEMQQHFTVPGGVEAAGQVDDECVRARRRQQTRDRDAIFAHHLGGRANAAARGEAQQGLDGGGARHTDSHQPVHVRCPQLLEPAQDRLRIKAELCHHCEVVAHVRDRGLLFALRLPQLLAADFGMPFRIARDTHPLTPYLPRSPVRMTASASAYGPSGCGGSPATTKARSIAASR